MALRDYHHGACAHCQFEWPQRPTGSSIRLPPGPAGAMMREPTEARDIKGHRMAHVISFRTALFDVSAETPNPINPLAGESALRWVREKLAHTQYRATAPSTEDWGWYIDVDGNGASYVVGANTDAENSALERDWVIQVHKHRSLTDRLLGRNKMAPDDPLFALIENIVRADSRCEQITVHRKL